MKKDISQQNEAKECNYCRKYKKRLYCLDLGQQDKDVDFLQISELRNRISTFPSE